MKRRHLDRFEMRYWIWIVGLASIAGCAPGVSRPGEPEVVWGRRGLTNGRFQKPRAMAIDDQDRLYIVDMTGRIQVFSPDGQFLRSWRTPEITDGRPTGLSFDRHGRLMVADTHYYRVLFYSTTGEIHEELAIGGVYGQGPGEFHFVTDCVQDSQGNYYVAEYGEFDRIQKFSPQREFLFQWGNQGERDRRFMRPQSLAIDEQDLLWVADSCNHRIQVFDARGHDAKLVKSWGSHGREPGQLSYPWGLILDSRGHVYVSERGNHRVQKFDRDGRSLGIWGTSGRRPGELNEPWTLVMDSQQRIHILDTYNHRVQRIRL